jgi:ribosomal protein S27AE
MSLHTRDILSARETARSKRGIPRELQTRPANECAQCGETIFMPEWSEWLNPACARHLWQCEACGYSFETTVRFAAA